MTRIKLRYWDEEHQKMVYSDDWGDLKWSAVQELIDRNLVMRSIGLLSCEKSLIFEGDILEVYNTYKEEKYKGYVAYQHGQFVIKKADLTSHYRWINYEVHILGNIYENKQLLIETPDSEVTT